MSGRRLGAGLDGFLELLVMFLGRVVLHLCRAARQTIDGHEAHHAIGDGKHAGDLVQRRRRHIEGEHVVERLALVLDLVGQLAPAPGVGRDPRSVTLLDDLLDAVDDSAMSLLGDLWLDQQHDLVRVDPDHLLRTRAAPASNGAAIRIAAAPHRSRKLSIVAGEYTGALPERGSVARIGWFLAGAATAAAALVAAPESYNRLRGLLETTGEAMHPPADETHTNPSDFAPAAAFAGYDSPADAAHSDEDTAELRLRIDETRQRIRRRAEDSAVTDA